MAIRSAVSGNVSSGNETTTFAVHEIADLPHHLAPGGPLEDVVPGHHAHQGAVVDHRQQPLPAHARPASSASMTS